MGGKADSDEVELHRIAGCRTGAVVELLRHLGIGWRFRREANWKPYDLRRELRVHRVEDADQSEIVKELEIMVFLRRRGGSWIATTGGLGMAMWKPGTVSTTTLRILGPVIPWWQSERYPLHSTNGTSTNAMRRYNPPRHSPTGQSNTAAGSLRPAAFA